MKPLYTDNDWARECPIILKGNYRQEPFRSQARRDYGRVLHSSSFRRLQGKTQLFPGRESDFFRNRLTHSLEVAQLAKSIALWLNHEHASFFSDEIRVDTDLCEMAGLAHDIGHPPFGHNGEQVLDELMQDFGGFEGNAQTLRVLARLEKRETTEDCHVDWAEDEKDHRIGLNLTYRALSSVLKYDHSIPQTNNERNPGGGKVKGYYLTESHLVARLKKNVTQTTTRNGSFKTLECSIMDLADDIAYATYDLEDALKVGFVSPISAVSTGTETIRTMYEELHQEYTPEEIVDRIQYQFGENLLPAPEIRATESMNSIVDAYTASENLARNGNMRTGFTSEMVQRFLEGIQFVPNQDHPELSYVQFNKDTKRDVEILKKFSFVLLISSSPMKAVAYRGKELVRRVFETVEKSAAHGDYLFPDDFKRAYEIAANSNEKRRVVCDFVASMTDRYALEFYGRLFSERPESIFKPL